MTTKQMFVAGSALGLVLLFLNSTTKAQPIPSDRVIRIAELEIDPAHLDEYIALLREEVETSIRVEPGVLMLYSVQLKDHPEKVRLFEMYANQAAYDVHIKSPHFLKYKTGTLQMVKSLTLLDATPILLGSKPRE